MTTILLILVIVIQAEVCLMLWFLRALAKVQHGHAELMRQLIAEYAKVTMIAKLPMERDR